ncbi:MAG: ComEC/Rec2 family competence protein [Lentisphaerae bacterium]|nr:ComEC/Rec2 family competence protein [Lentisphaerota bacterium]
MSSEYVGFKRRPAVGLGCAYAIGILCGILYNVSFVIPVALAAALAVICVAMLAMAEKNSSLSRFINPLLFLIIICIGWATGSFEAEELRYGNKPWDTDKIEIIGIVCNDPEPAFESASGESVWAFNFKTEHVVVGCVPSRVRVFWHMASNVSKHKWKHYAPKYGDKLRIRGQIRRYKHGSPNFMAKTSKRADIDTGPGRSLFLSRDHGSAFVRGCLEGRRSAYRLLALGIEEHTQSVALIHALLLGYRSQMTSEIKNIFAETGVLHVFAISGLHVGIIAVLLTRLLRIFRVSRVYWVLFLCPCLLVYTVATGARASAVRACVMAIVYYLAPLVRRKADIPSAIAVAGILILTWAPLQITDVGFIFSFIVVIGIVALYPLFDRPLKRFWEPDPFLQWTGGGNSLHAVGDSVWIRLRRVTGRYVSSLAAMSIAAWLSSAPLTMYFFSRLSVAALIANIFVIPLAFMIVLTGCLTIVFGTCLSWMAVTFNHANLILVHAQIAIVSLASRIPFGSVAVQTPPIWIVCAWYMLLAVIAIRFYARGLSDITHKAC